MAVRGITDTGLSTAASIARVAAGAVAVINTVAMLRMAALQHEIAEGYLNISEEQYNYYIYNYAPCEDIALQEACSAALCTPAYARHTGRMLNSAKLAAENSTRDSLRGVSRYCTGKRAALLQNNFIAQAMREAAVANMGRRYAEDYCDAMDDRRWARRAQELNRWRDIAADTVAYSGFAHGMFGRLGNQAAAGAMGAMRFLGYSGERNQTQYPGREPLWTGAGPTYKRSVPPAYKTPVPVAPPVPPQAVIRG